MEKCKFHYDENYDRLFISCKQDNEKIYGSVRLLNIIIDFTTENRAVCFEIMQISKYLDSLGINPEILNKLTNIEVFFSKEGDGYLIHFILYARNYVERVPYNIIIENPVLTH